MSEEMMPLPKRGEVRKLLVQFECGQGTRWLYPPEKTMTALQVLLEVIAKVQTSGPVPRVSVMEAQ